VDVLPYGGSLAIPAEQCRGLVDDMTGRAELQGPWNVGMEGFTEGFTGFSCGRRLLPNLARPHSRPCREQNIETFAIASWVRTCFPRARGSAPGAPSRRIQPDARE
jgi:hypothetical protein